LKGDRIDIKDLSFGLRTSRIRIIEQNNGYYLTSESKVKTKTLFDALPFYEQYQNDYATQVMSKEILFSI